MAALFFGIRSTLTARIMEIWNKDYQQKNFVILALGAYKYYEFLIERVEDSLMLIRVISTCHS